MVGIHATQVVDMHGDARMIDQSLKELAHQIDIEIADIRAHKLNIEFQTGPAG